VVVLAAKRKIWNSKSILFILPVLVVLVFLDFYPISYSIYISFTNFGEFHFFNYTLIGLSNYIRIVKSGFLWQLLLQNAIYAVGSVALFAPLGFIIALVMNQKGLRGKTFYRTAILFPWAYPAFITILIWQGMLDYRFGIVNELLEKVGLKPIYWLGTPGTAMLSIIMVNLWLSFPYYTYVFTSAMQSIPSELYEAAEMDGYGPFGRLRTIIIPMLSRQIAFVVIFGFIFTWNNFYIPFLLTGGGPGTSTQILITYSYYSAFSYLQFGIGAAYSVISILVLLVIVVIANHYSKMMTVLY
jgi:arabinogalactan oligomer/maltooligosaccharide transport system permease protein